MKFEVYDKAKWHYDSKDMPKDLPAIAGATHIAFLVRWCVENDLMSREIEEDCAEELQQIKNKELDCRDFFGSSDISSDSVLTKKTAEQIVYLNNHKQMYNYEQQFFISCVGSI